MVQGRGQHGIGEDSAVDRQGQPLTRLLTGGGGCTWAHPQYQPEHAMTLSVLSLRGISLSLPNKPGSLMPPLAHETLFLMPGILFLHFSAWMSPLREASGPRLLGRRLLWAPTAPGSPHQRPDCLGHQCLPTLPNMARPLLSPTPPCIK